MKKCFTLIELMLVLALIAVIAAIAIPGLIEARKGANEASAVASIRSILSAESVYRERNEAKMYGSLAQLHSLNLIDDQLSTGTRNGYHFGLTIDNARPEYLYTLTANPAVPGQTGKRFFYTDNSGVIRFNVNQPAGPTDDAINRN